MALPDSLESWGSQDLQAGLETRDLKVIRDHRALLDFLAIRVNRFDCYLSCLLSGQLVACHIVSFAR